MVDTLGTLQKAAWRAGSFPRGLQASTSSQDKGSYKCYFGTQNHIGDRDERRRFPKEVSHSEWKQTPLWKGCPNLCKFLLNGDGRKSSFFRRHDFERKCSRQWCFLV